MIRRNAGGFDVHECEPDCKTRKAKNRYGDVARNMGGTGAPHPWELTLDVESTQIDYCPWCGERLPRPARSPPRSNP